ncbi:MAG: Ig-like domain-containing protein, partial [Methylotenera sp.]
TVNESGSKGTLTFSATAVDDKGVVKVEFLLDNALVGTTTLAPYSMTYDSLMQDDGNHTLVAKATDTSGQYTKATMTFNIANGQLVRNGSFEKGYGVGWSNTTGMQIGTILGQTAYDGTKMAKFCGTGSQMSVSLYQSVAIPANASQATLSYALHIESKETSGSARDTFAVQILNSSGAILKTLTTYSNLNAATGYKVFSFDLSEYKGQTIQLYVKGAEDAALATGFILDKVNLMITSGGGDTAPTVSASESGSSGMITFSATASDDVGVTKVEFYVDGVIKGTDETAPYSMELDSKTLTDNTPHVLVAKAYDATGKVGTSSPVNFIVDNTGVDPELPVISVNESGTSGAITLTATATDNIGVTKVEFYVDNALKGTDTNAPYSVPLDSLTLTDGKHDLLGKAYDAAGNMGTSSVFTFNVNNAGSSPTTYNETENNGSTGTANVIADTITRITGYIGTSTDQDYFKINVSSGRTVTVNMTGPAKDYDLYLLNSSGATVKTSANIGSTESVSYKNTGTAIATYYIKVVSFGGAYTTTTPYNLALIR